MDHFEMTIDHIYATFGIECRTFQFQGVGSQIIVSIQMADVESTRIRQSKISSPRKAKIVRGCKVTETAVSAGIFTHDHFGGFKRSIIDHDALEVRKGLRLNTIQTDR